MVSTELAGMPRDVGNLKPPSFPVTSREFGFRGWSSTEKQEATIDAKHVDGGWRTEECEVFLGGAIAKKYVCNSSDSADSHAPQATLYVISRSSQRISLFCWALFFLAAFILVYVHKERVKGLSGIQDDILGLGSFVALPLGIYILSLSLKFLKKYFGTISGLPHWGMTLLWPRTACVVFVSFAVILAVLRFYPLYSIRNQTDLSLAIAFEKDSPMTMLPNEELFLSSHPSTHRLVSVEGDSKHPCLGSIEIDELHERQLGRGGAMLIKKKPAQQTHLSLVRHPDDGAGAVTLSTGHIDSCEEPAVITSSSENNRATVSITTPGDSIDLEFRNKGSGELFGRLECSYVAAYEKGGRELIVSPLIHSGQMQPLREFILKRRENGGDFVSKWTTMSADAYSGPVWTCDRAHGVQSAWDKMIVKLNNTAYEKQSWSWEFPARQVPKSFYLEDTNGARRGEGSCMLSEHQGDESVLSVGPIEIVTRQGRTVTPRNLSNSVIFGFVDSPLESTGWTWSKKGGSSSMPPWLCLPTAAVTDAGGTMREVVPGGRALKTSLDMARRRILVQTRTCFVDIDGRPVSPCRHPSEKISPELVSSARARDAFCREVKLCR